MSEMQSTLLLCHHMYPGCSDRYNLDSSLSTVRLLQAAQLVLQVLLCA